jgi:GDP-L-fucose synthase
MKAADRIFVAGHTGMVGSAIVRKLRLLGYDDLLLRSHSELDLTDQSSVVSFFHAFRPDYVIMAAGKVGGIYANATRKVEFLYDNVVMATNVIRAAAENDTQRLLYLGSSSVFPREAAQPVREEALLTGALEVTNEGYALAKIVGLKLCQYYSLGGKSFIAAMPSNLYGPGDKFHLLDSHVVAGMMRKLHEARQARQETVVLWGTGEPSRELLYVDDLANAVCLLLKNYDDPQFINVGSGAEVKIRELAHMISDVVGYRGEIAFDPSQPDGMPRKGLDSSRMRALGWKPEVALMEGLRHTYQWALNHGALSPSNPVPPHEGSVRT